MNFINIKFYIVAAGLFLLNLSGLAVANTITAQVASNKSSSSQHLVQEEPTITNEAEYAEYRKRVDKRNQTTSAKSTTASGTSSSAKSIGSSAK